MHIINRFFVCSCNVPLMRLALYVISCHRQYCFSLRVPHLCSPQHRTQQDSIIIIYHNDSCSVYYMKGLIVLTAPPGWKPQSASSPSICLHRQHQSLTLRSSGQPAPLTAMDSSSLYGYASLSLLYLFLFDFSSDGARTGDSWQMTAGSSSHGYVP